MISFDVKQLKNVSIEVMFASKICHSSFIIHIDLIDIFSGHNDCEDSSDEEHCSNRDQEIYLSFSLHQDYTCMYGYRCVYERSESLDQLPLCISLNQLCDGIQQCPLGDDEHPRRCRTFDQSFYFVFSIFHLFRT